MITEKKPRRRILDWEKWPFFVIYAPLIVAWAYYAIRARAFWFMSNVNPTIEFSGFEGEAKEEMYTQLPKDLYPATICIKAGTDFQRVQTMLMESEIQYPFVVKPDVGMQGLLFRKIEIEAELFHYHSQVPVDYVIQEFVDLPLEFSVFHIRYPGAIKGKITGFILKEYMAVEGDGTATLYELIIRHPKANVRLREMQAKHDAHLERVLTKGEKFTLSIAGNHNRGARFINLYHEVDSQLTDVFDNISMQVGEFYYGRYDVKCTSIADLKAGKNFSILEFNGTGAEPNHIYDCGMSYDSALTEIVSHWRDMYRIGRINLERGYPHWNFMRGYRYLKNARKFFKTLREFDINLDAEKK